MAPSSVAANDVTGKWSGKEDKYSVWTGTYVNPNGIYGHFEGVKRID